MRSSIPGSWSEWIRDPSPTGRDRARTERTRRHNGAASVIFRANFPPRRRPLELDNTARKLRASTGWNIEDSLELYGVKAWSNGYFGINDAGHVVVRPDQTTEHEIDLYEVIRGLEARDLSTPVVVRFSDILRHRLKRLNDAFATAIAENEYKNRYAAVFPIKVNQQRLVVEEVYGYGKEFGFGLEVGSKPELLAVMAMTEGESERMIVCNGFKDDSYIEAVILATKLGPHDHPGRREFRRAAADPASTRQLRRPAAHRRARQARDRGCRTLARVVGREIEVRTCSSPRSSSSCATLRSRGMEDCLQLVHCHPAASCRTSVVSRTPSTSSRTSTPSSS